MDLEMTVDLLMHALDKELESAAWDIWISKVPSMSKDNVIDFEPFFEKLKKSSKKQKPVEKTYEEIEIEMEKVVSAYEKKVKNGF
jgi:hypothetical protein